MAILGYSKTQITDGGWFTSAEYDLNTIAKIQDPDGGNVTEMPTSIPSPFARFDLVKGAFGAIAQTRELKAQKDGNDVRASKFDEKLVSDTLDLLEILFNLEVRSEFKNNNYWRVLIWDRNAELQKLKSSSEIGHQRLGKALQLFLTDSASGLNDLNRLYLFQLQGQIIGCTSPKTLVVTTANDLRFARLQLMGSDVLFDGDYCSIIKRDKRFQKYLFSMFEANPQLKTAMPEFSRYLDKAKQIIGETDPAYYSEVITFGQSALDELGTVPASPNPSDIEVLGVPLRALSEKAGRTTIENSDFVINATKRIDPSSAPLVLFNGFSGGLRYGNDPWSSNIVVPYEDPRPLAERTLPNLGVKYPYVTVSDFLEPYLIKLVYPIDQNNFYCPSFRSDNENGYLLPLKKEFFDYFSAEDLVVGGSNKPMLTFEDLPGNAVRVKLKVPIGKTGQHSITLERTYKESVTTHESAAEPDKNLGYIREVKVGLAIFPMFKSEEAGAKTFHKVQLIDADYGEDHFGDSADLKFYADANGECKVINAEGKARRAKERGVDGGTKYYSLKESFDAMQVTAGRVSGMVLPRWKVYPKGTQELSFAIDFGTSNTHVEYTSDGTNYKPFEISGNEVQVASLVQRSDSVTRETILRSYIDFEFVPHVIGPDASGSEGYRFPSRTVLSENKGLAAAAVTSSLIDYNIAFIYEKKSDRKSRFVTNLKWSEMTAQNEGRLKAFLEQLAMMIRNKVIVNHGNLAATKIVWFYPTSMSEGKVGLLKEAWNSVLAEFFNEASIGERTYRIPESLAPFFFFRNSNRLEGGAVKPVVCVDIGGGTTDIVVFENKEPALLTSFRFAGNAIFGDGFSAIKSNGLADKYAAQFETKFQNHHLPAVRSLGEVLKSLSDSKSEDMNAFLFSVENLPVIGEMSAGEKEQFSYNRMLRSNSETKIIFVYFFSAIAYHIAKLMKLKGIEPPQNMVFSGTASKLLDVLSPEKKFIGDLFKVIFEHVYGQSIPYNIAVITEPTGQKEVTCKGGLMAGGSDLGNIDNLTEKTIELSCLPNDPLKQLRYSEFTPETLDEITKAVEEFNEFFLSIAEEAKFESRFMASPTSIAALTEIARGTNEVRGGLDLGLDKTMQMDRITDKNLKIGETAFFFPLIGIINKLTRRLA